MVISSAAGSASTAWWCRTGRPRVSRPGHHAGTRRAGAPDLARHDTDQQAGGLCVRPGREGLYPGRGADRRAFALRRRPRAAALRARPSGRPGRGRPAGHRFPGPAGADAGRSHRQAADRRGFRGRQGIPGARAGQPVGSRPRTVESRPVAGRQGPAAGPGALAEQRPAALRAARGQEASDPPHVRAGRPQGGGPEARAHRPRGAGRPAAGAVALSARGRALRSAPSRSGRRPGPYPHTDFSVCFQRAVIS